MKTWIGPFAPLAPAGRLITPVCTVSTECVVSTRSFCVAAGRDLCDHCGVRAARPDRSTSAGNAVTGQDRPTARRRPAMDWIAVGLFALGLIFVATGLLPASSADTTIRRILPLLLFLGTVIVLAELTAGAGGFDVIAV